LRILFVSQCGESLPIALRCQAEGAEVRWYVHDRDSADVGRGLLQRVPDWRPSVGWSDLVVFDEVAMHEDHGQGEYGGGKWAAQVRKAGKPAVGGSPDTDQLENDRDYGQRVCKALGLEPVPMHGFKGPAAFDQAAKFVQAHPGAYALKHNSECPKDLATVQWTPQDMIDYLKWLEGSWRRFAGAEPPDFVLQEAIKGIEISTTALFDGHAWRGVIAAQEYKRLLAGNLGPMTGAMGEVACAGQERSRLWRTALDRLGPWLARQGYRGVIDLSFIATEERLVPLEFTARFGYGTFANVFELLENPVLDALWTMATGDGELRWRTGYACYVAVGSGCFPMTDSRRNDGLYLGGQWRSEQVWPMEVRAPAGHGRAWNQRAGPPPDHLESAGGGGLLCYCSGSGPDIASAREAAYRTSGKVKVLPTRIQRDDIGRQAVRDFQQLREWGWLS
jgi:phosphoribosylamine--glycine ligase